MMLAKVKEQDGMMLAKVKEHDGIQAQVSHAEPHTELSAKYPYISGLNRGFSKQ